MRKQFRLAGRATVIALSITMVRLAAAVLTQNISIAISPPTTYLTVALAAFVASWRWGLNPLMAWSAGYFYGWAVLFFLNSSIVAAALEKSPGTLITGMIILPIPVAIAASIGSVAGIVPHHFRKRRVLGRGEATST